MFFFVLSCLFLLTAKPVSPSCPLQVSPSKVVVKYGDPISVNCTSTSPHTINMGWESPQGGTEPEEVTSVLLAIKKIEKWVLFPKCFINLAVEPRQCLTNLQVTVYKPPDRVSISKASDSGSPKEGEDKTIECFVTGVFPRRNLQVSWFKGDQVVFTQSFNESSDKSPLNASAFYTWSARREDDGVGVRCEAKLTFGPTGPDLPATKSKTEKLSVLYRPEFTEPQERITLKGSEGLSLNCTVSANPAPKYTWRLPPSAPKQKGPDDLTQPILDLSFPMPGTYACTASNPFGTTTKSFVVTQKPRSPAGTTAGIVIAVFFVLIFIAACVVYRRQKSSDVARTENIR